MKGENLTSKHTALFTGGQILIMFLVLTVLSRLSSVPELQFASLFIWLSLLLRKKKENKVCHTITDTAGRRDIMHMRLTNNQCFVRFTGANHPSDVDRLDEWFERLTEWKEQGIDQINFFIHQTIEKDLQMLSARLIQRINKEWGYNMKIPGQEVQGSLF